MGFPVSNEPAGYAALIARLRPLDVKRIVLEATADRGFYRRLTARECQRSGDYRQRVYWSLPFRAFG